MKKREPKEYVIQPKGWKKRYKCHKLKADHNYVVVYASIPSWYYIRNGKPIEEKNIFEYWECTACGKKHLSIEKDDV